MMTLRPTAAALRRRLAEIEREAERTREALAAAEDCERGVIAQIIDSLAHLPLREARGVFEREYLCRQLARFGGTVSHAAEAVGMERSALARKLAHLGIRKGTS